MFFWLWLCLLGLMIYFILDRSVRKITRTPIWLLWLVMMTPPFLLSLSLLIYGQQKVLSSWLIIPFIIFPLIYWWLVQKGRDPVSSSPSPESQSSPSSSDSPPPHTEELRPIEPGEEEQLRNCFPWSVFAIHTIEYRPQAVICRGQLRTQSEIAYQTIENNIKDLFGERFLLLFQTSSSGQHFFALVPNPQQKSAEKDVFNQEPLTRPILALSLLILTLITTTFAGAEMSGIATTKLIENPTLILKGLPYAFGLMAIFASHEFSHYFTARFYQIPVTLPYFIPFPFFLGTVGAFISMKRPAPTRQALFDVSIAGPIGGFIVTIPLLIWGLHHSEIVPLSSRSGMLNFDSFNPKFSLLMTLFCKLIFASDFTAQNAIDLHPIAVVGYLGIIITAYNLVPLGQLDGGHIIHGMFGHQTTVVVGQISRLIMLVLSFLEPGLLLWTILLFLMPAYDEPALNDVTELDNFRDGIGFLALGLLLMIILPAPKILLH